MKVSFILLIAVVAFIAGSFFFPVAVEYQLPENANAQKVVDRSDDEQKNIDIYKTTNEAVVFISTVTMTIDPFDWYPEVQPQKGIGAGVIIDKEDGIILTNIHVISSAHKIEIILSDGLKYAAKPLGYDYLYDLAVLQLKTPPKNLTAINLGDSDSLEVGQKVLAIGNPFGLNRTLTTGVISSLDRTVKTHSGSLLKGLIQTDAAINKGNSGGALLDTAGNLIGINTVILSQSGDSAGIGFALPINRIKKVLPELIATGKVLRARVGWILIDTKQGPMIRRVMSNSPAEKAKIQPIERYIRRGLLSGYIRDYEQAELLYSINGNRVKSKIEVENIIEDLKAGEEIEVVLKQGGLYGKERTINIQPIWE